MIEFNINDNVFVKLTDLGRTELKRQHDQLNKEINGVLGGYRPIVEDKDGWSKWQLHDLMNHFGHMMYVGFEMPFETTIRIENITNEVMKEIEVWNSAIDFSNKVKNTILDGVVKKLDKEIMGGE